MLFVVVDLLTFSCSHHEEVRTKLGSSEEMLRNLTLDKEEEVTTCRIVTLAVKEEVTTPLAVTKKVIDCSKILPDPISE